jgi:hypothetical protein
MMPRGARHKLAQLHATIGFAQTSAGQLEEALASVTKALSYSPLEKQRRALFIDLGDLYVGERTGASAAAVAVLERVERGGVCEV